MHWGWESVSAAAHSYSRGTLSPGFLINSVSLDLLAQQLICISSKNLKNKKVFGSIAVNYNCCQEREKDTGKRLGNLPGAIGNL